MTDIQQNQSMEQEEGKISNPPNDPESTALGMPNSELGNEPSSKFIKSDAGEPIATKSEPQRHSVNPMPMKQDISNVKRQTDDQPQRKNYRVKFENNLLLKVNTMNLHKHTKGILVHNGYFFVSDLMKHFHKVNKNEKIAAQGAKQAQKPLDQAPAIGLLNLDFEIELTNDLKTDPSLDQDQIESIQRELERLYDLYDKLMVFKPMEFQLNQKELPPEMGKRRYISLMKELIYIPENYQELLLDEPEDNFLDIVFGLGEVTELCGLNSTGKSQICFQLSLNCQIPSCLGGAEGQSLYIDTHGDFSVDRISEMAKNLRSTVLKKIDKDPTKLKQYKDEFTIEKILSKIHYMRILDESEQQLLHQMLPQIVLKIPDLRLIVIDTFAEHFRATDVGYNDRKKMITTALQGLQMVAHQHNITVVLINNMKTGRRDFVAEQVAAGNQLQGVLPGGYMQPMPQAKPEPLFGEELFQCVTNRIMLERDHNSNEDNIIRGKLIKGSVATQFTSYPNAHFQIFEKGIAPII